MAETLLESENPRASPGRRVSDPEIIALDKVIEVFDDLEPGARSRAMLYLNARFYQATQPLTKDQLDEVTNGRR